MPPEKERVRQVAIGASGEIVLLDSAGGLWRFYARVGQPMTARDWEKVPLPEELQARGIS